MYLMKVFHLHNDLKFTESLTYSVLYSLFYLHCKSLVSLQILSNMENNGRRPTQLAIISWGSVRWNWQSNPERLSRWVILMWQLQMLLQALPSPWVENGLVETKWKLTNTRALYFSRWDLDRRENKGNQRIMIMAAQSETFFINIFGCPCQRQVL